MTKNNGWCCRMVGLPTVRRTALTALAIMGFVSAAGMISAASGPERSLAGVPIFAPGSEVTRKFGNPSRILVGGVSPGTAGAGAAAGGGGGYPGGGGGGYPGGGGGGYPGGGGGGYPGGGGGNAGAGLLPGFAGVSTGGGYPGGGGGYPGGGGGYPGGGGGTTDPSAGLPVKLPVTLIYDRALGGDLEFTISPDKRVVQIRETGYSGSYGTTRGIKLGTTYSQVIARYGYPEDTYITGPIINIDYKSTLHCGFQFLDQKLVGIIVASPD